MKFTILILSTLFLLLSAGIGDLYAQTDAEPVCVAIPADVNGEVDVKPVSVAIPADVTGELDVKPVSIKLQLQSTSSDPTLTPTVAAPAYPTKSNSFTLTGTKKANSYLYVSNQLTAASFSATTWSASVYLPVEGSNTFGVFAVDGSGNQSQTVSVTVVRDTIPPAVTISAPSSGALTRNRQITVSGTVNEPVVSVTVNGVVATMNGQEWSAACQLEEGINTITAQATDLAGNRGAASITVTLDSTPPQLKVSTLSDGAFTNNGTLNIAGTVQDEKGLQALRINGVIVPVNADSGFSFALILQSGSNVVTTVATDLAGNQTSDIRTIILDQTAPLLIITSPSDNAKTGSAVIAVGGNIDENSDVVVKLGDKVQSAILTGNTFSANVTLIPGYNTIEITATDLAGNTSTQKRTIVFDDQTPSLSITGPGEDIRTAKATLTIRGSASDPYTNVTLSVDVDLQRYTPALIDGNFEQTVSFTEEKSYAVVVTATNEVGTTTSIQRNIIYDVTPPALTIDKAASPTNQPGITVSGTMEAGATVTVSSSTAVAGDASYPTPTTWSAAVSGFTSEINDIKVTAVDPAGNVTVAITRVIYDTTPPTGSIVINGGAALTNSTQVQLSLTAADAFGVSQMRFSQDGANWMDPEAYASARGWFLPSGDGAKRVYVRFGDSAGNWSEAISAGITLDTVPPVAAAFPAGGIYNTAQIVTLAANEAAAIFYTTDGAMPTVGSSLYSQSIPITASAVLKYFARDAAGNIGEIKTENYTIDMFPPVLNVSTLGDGAYTNNETLNIAGTIQDNSGVRDLRINGVTVAVNTDGSFSHALLLNKGSNAVTVVATDLAGNQAVDTRTIILDQTAPQLTVVMPADNAKTGTALLTVSGTVDKTSSVTIRLGDTIQLAAMNGGAFTAPVNLVYGYNTIEITATDLAGNLSSQKRTVIFDDQKPSLAVTEPNQDIRTNQGSLAIKGTVFDALTAVKVTISKDGDTFVPPVVNGAFEQNVTFQEEKTYGIIVTATNEAGTSTSVQRNVIYDSTPPALTIDAVTSPTNQPNQIISGRRESDTAVAVTCPTATVREISYPTATTWEVNIAGLKEGENVVTATSTDAAGNPATASAKIILSRIPLEVTVTATPNVIWPPNHKMVPVTIGGGVLANGAKIQSVSITIKDEYGKYNYKNLKFGDTVLLEAWRNGGDREGRVYTVTAIAADKTGNIATQSTTVVVPHNMSK